MSFQSQFNALETSIYLCWMRSYCIAEICVERHIIVSKGPNNSSSRRTDAVRVGSCSRLIDPVDKIWNFLNWMVAIWN